MFGHYLKIFLRTAGRSKGYTFINVSGITVSLTCAILALLWIVDEFTFDRFHTNQKRIFSIQSNFRSDTGINTYQDTPGKLSHALKEYPEVQESSRGVFRSRILVQHQNESNLERVVYADRSIFNVLTLPLIEGSARDLVPDANSAVISEKLAHKYFGNESPLGKTIRINGKTDVKITAVIQDLPTQSTLQFQLLLPYELYASEDQYNEEWGAWTGGFTFVLLREDADTKMLEKKIQDHITKPKIWPRWGDNVELSLFSMEDWHLRATFENGKQTGGRITYVKIFGLVSVFILIVAAINFMNLSTARSLSRAKEIGVRKVVGAIRRKLVTQFLSEAVLTSFVSFVLALFLVHLLLPYFNQLSEKDISLDYLNPKLSLALVGIALAMGMVAGSYPAFFLSSLSAIQALKDKLTGGSGANIRKTLVVFQFALSVILIICALVVHRQIEYMRNKNLGFERDHTFYVRASPHLSKNFEEFKQLLIHQAGIVAISRAADEPMNIETALEMGENGWRGKTSDDNVVFQWLFCDESFLEAFNFKFIEGRNFSAEYPADSNNFIINKEAARRMRLDKPLGEVINVDRKGSIIGVIEDFHGSGLSNPIQPVIVSMRLDDSNRIFIHYESERLSEVMHSVQSVFKKLEPDFPMEYIFLDDAFDTQYKKELLIGRLATVFTGIAVFVSCLGLFGLSSFTAEQRTKEIGIRKVLGASVSQLTILMCRDFIMLVAIALVIGCPVASWFGNEFLRTYAFHTDLPVSVFLITVVCLITITLLTVSFQSIKSALANPVRSLRSE